MKASNWIVADIANKRADLTAYTKTITTHMSEEQIVAVAAISNLNREALFKRWKSLPSFYKNQNKKFNLGCA